MPDSTLTAPACPQFSRTVEPDWVVCPACLTKLPAAAKTLTTELATKSLLFGSGVTDRSHTSADEGRFPGGTVLAARYRVLGKMGR